METAKPAAELSSHDLSVIQEAKALIEKLNAVMQSAERQQTQLESTPPNDDHDTASNFSGYSMLTPSTRTKSDREQGKSLTEQPVLPGPHVEESVVSKAPELERSAYDFGTVQSDDQQQGKNSTTAEYAPVKGMPVLQEESKPTNQKSKLVGIVITLGQGIDMDQGEKAIRFIGDHLSLISELPAEDIRVLSLAGDESLEVALAPQPEPDHDHFAGLGKSDDLVATINRANGNRKKQDSASEHAPALPTDDFPFLPFPSELPDLPYTPGKKEELLSKRIELEEARTLRSLIGSRDKICSCNGFLSHTEPAPRIPDSLASNGSPKLSDLISFAKAKVQHELTAARVHPVIPHNTKEKGGVPESTRSLQSQFWGTKSMVLMRGERVIIAIIVSLCLTITLSLLGNAYMSAQTQDRCFGISWKS